MEASTDCSIAKKKNGATNCSCTVYPDFVTKQSNSVLKGNNCVNDDAISFRNQVGLVMEWAPHCRADMGRLQNSFKSNPDSVIFTLGASDQNTLAFLVCHGASDFFCEIGTGLGFFFF